MFNPINTSMPSTRMPNEHHDVKDQTVASKTNVSEVEETGIKPQVTQFDVDTVVSNILDFVRQRISSAPAEEQAEMLEQAKEGILKGFSEAGSMLEDMGRLNPGFESGMDNALSMLNDKLADVDSLFAKDDVVESKIESSTSKAIQTELFASNSQSLSMTVTTRDGDKINIKYSADSMQQASLMSNKYGYMYQWASIENTGLSMMVEGELDVDEMKALNSLLNDVDKLANEFFDGDLSVAFKMAQELDMDMSELASLDLSMKEVDVAAVKAYGQNSHAGQSHLPKGLTPLAQYAKSMVEAAEKINAEAVFVPQQLLDLLEIHPLQQSGNKPAQQSIFNQLFGK